MAKVEAPCIQGPRAAHDSGARRASSIRLVVLHSAEGSSAKGVAAFFAQKSTQASTQLAADQTCCVRMLPDLVIPWGAPGANSNGLHIEMCGYARWTREQWLAKDAMLRRSAYKVAMWCFHYAIPARYVTVKSLVDGTAHGLTFHVDVSKAFKGSDHWDPGPGFPRDVFLSYVKTYLKAIETERSGRR